MKKAPPSHILLQFFSPKKLKICRGAIISPLMGVITPKLTAKKAPEKWMGIFQD